MLLGTALGFQFGGFNPDMENIILPKANNECGSMTYVTSPLPRKEPVMADKFLPLKHFCTKYIKPIFLPKLYSHQ